MAAQTSKIEFAPGVIKDDSELAAEGGFVDADKVRFRQGKPQVIGGWAKLLASQFSGGNVRGAHSWTDLDGNGWLGFATDDKIYLVDKTTLTLTEYTNKHAEGTVDAVNFDLPNVTEVDTVHGTNFTLKDANNGQIINFGSTWTGSDTFYFDGPSGAGLSAGFTCYVANYSGGSRSLSRFGSTLTINGTTSYSLSANTAIKLTLVGTDLAVETLTTVYAVSTTNGSPAVSMYTPSHGFAVGQSITLSNVAAVGGLTISGTRTVASIIDGDNWTWTAGSNASSTATGGPYDWSAAWLTGLSPTLPTVWSLDNFGEVLLAVRRGGGLYAIQPATSYPELVLNGTFASSSNWALGTDWTISVGVATATAGTGSNLSQNVQGVLIPGYTYRVIFDATVAAGTVRFQVNAGMPAAVIEVGTASIKVQQSGSYSRLFVCPADPRDIVFAKDSTFAGTIDNVSIKLENKAFRVNEAPAQIDTMFVDPNRIVVLCGTYEVDGDYNPNLVRWSGQENFRTWIPSDENLAGEYPLAKGGRIVSGIAARQQNLILMDDCIHSMQFTGDATTGFTFRLMGTGCGLIGKNAVTEQNGTVLWLGSDGNFYIFQGAVPQVIDCRIRKDVADHISSGKGELIWAGVNSEFSEIWWFYPDSRDGTECSRYAAFNWIEQTWTCGTFARTAWVRRGIFSYPIAFGTDGYIYKHETGNTADGSALSWYVETGYFDVKDGGNLMRITRIWPDFLQQTGDVNFYIRSKSYPNQASPVSTGPHVSTTTTPQLNVRREARQMKLRMEGSANGSYMRFGCLRIDAEESRALR